MKAIVTSDNHLNKYYSKMRPNQLEERRKQIAEQFGKVVDYAIEEDADLFLHCGDLFDMPNPRNPAVSYVAGKLVELKQNGIPSFLIVGNHDKPKMTTGAGGSSPQDIYDSFDVSRVFKHADRIETETLKVDGVEVAVSGISHNPLLGEDEDPLQGKSVDADADVSILLAHYGVEDHLAGRTNEPIISHGSVDSLDIDVLCSGHIHKPADLSIGGTEIIVPGGTERMGFGEIDRDTGFYVFSAGDGGIEAEYIDLEPQPMHEETISANALKHENATKKALKIAGGSSDADQMFKLRLEGTLTRDQYHRLDVRQLWNQGRSSNFYFDLVDDIEFEVENRIGVNGERLSQVEELKRVAGQVEESAEDDEKEAVREAREKVLSDYGGER
jgi:DNA repair exonuclease SbcCD nuclease subunit